MNIDLDDYEWAEHPWFCDRKRSRNWVAVVTQDRKSPGGLARKWCHKKRNGFVWCAENVEVGDVLEFGSDYYTFSGKKRPKRHYARVVEKKEGPLLRLGKALTEPNAFFPKLSRKR